MKVYDILSEASEPKQPKTRNPVAHAAQKVAKGSGVHKDKKKAAKQGEVKHKKDIVAEDNRSENENILAKIANAGDAGYDLIYDGLNGKFGSDAQTVLQDMYDQVSINDRLHPDDDFEQIIDRMMDQLESDYGNQGVAEDAGGNRTKTMKVFKDKSGKPVGEIGIDLDSNPEAQDWYVHHYDTGYNVLGFNNATEAKKELMYVHQHPESVNEGASEETTDVYRKVFKKNGKPVGEVGIDLEASPGNGDWYVKHYASGTDYSGYDTRQDAIDELKYMVSQGLDEDWNKALVTGLTAASIAAGGALGWQAGTKINREVNKLEQAHAELVVKNPEKAAELQKAIDKIYITKGNAKLNATTFRNIKRANELIKEQGVAEGEYDPSYDPDYRPYQKPEQDPDAWKQDRDNADEKESDKIVYIIDDNTEEVVLKFKSTGGYYGDVRHALEHGYDTENGDYRIKWKRTDVNETATAGATSAGNVSVGAVYKNKPGKTLKNPDGTAKNALDTKANLMTGGSIKR